MKNIQTLQDNQVIDAHLNPLQKMLKLCKSAFWVVFFFAFISNLLMLITPLYSLQVLDRVLGSGSYETLLMLSIIIGGIYFIYGLVQISRSFTLIKIGEWLDNKLSPILFAQAISASATRVNLAAGQLLRDFQTVKTFLTSTGINTLFDAPWSIVYIIVTFLIHPYIGVITIVGAIIIISTAFFNAMATNKSLGEATDYSNKSMIQAEIANRNAETVEAMGMIKNVTRNWHQFSEAALAKQSAASYRNSVISNFSTFVRSLMQMMVTGVGAYVVVRSGGQEMTTGGMIMSSIIVGKALAPFNNAIEMWKIISGALKSYKNINNAFSKYTPRDDSMPIPNVQGHFVAEDVSYITMPRNNILSQMQLHAKPQYVLQDISFNVAPGEVLAIIGPSASGKSTLAKIMVGVWKAYSGNVRLDGGEIFRWNRDDFGRHIGYLPQGIELFSGTIKQNIARMAENPDPELVIKAAKIAGAHDMILGFAEGYDTDIGTGGANLSGGQRQRIALARSFYGNPKMIILDEPNANLDEVGEIALSNALLTAKSNKMSSIVISHRPSVLSIADKILILQNGKVAAFGSAAEIKNHIKMLNSGTIHIN